MSGRSAYVRKEKTKTKDGDHAGSENGSNRGDSVYEDLPLRSSGRSIHSPRDTPSRGHTDHSVPKPNWDDMAYARVRKPQMPVLDVSGIEKSSFRSLMDRKSEGVRNGLAKPFSRKKKEETTPPQTGQPGQAEDFEIDADNYIDVHVVHSPRETQHPGLPELADGSVVARPRQHADLPDYIRSGPPRGKLPPIPRGPQLKRWAGGGRPVQPWNKLRKDPELWDVNGDTLIYLGDEEQNSPRPQPSFRVSSHVLESTESRYLIIALREGSTEDVNRGDLPPSPIDSLAMGVPRHAPSNRYHTPPQSENSQGSYDGQISYELYFPPPAHLNKIDAIRHQVSTRNMLAVLYQTSFVGTNFFQALKDVQERLAEYMPSSTDVVSMIIDYIISTGLDDIRGNPSLAAAMLSWSEGESVRWEEAWRETFVHCVGMHSKVENSPDFRFVTPITRALLERASLEMQVRIHTCESSLFDLDFGDMLAMLKPGSTSARKAFDNLRTFFLQYYKKAYGGTWPPAATADEERWLTREHAQRLQKDFGALYNFLVNREVVWDCTEASAGRKWNMVHSGKRSFDADTPDLPLTDVLIAFDNKHSYPHIPHPYPLVPQSVPQQPKGTSSKVSKKGPKPIGDKMAERMAALSYTESTNIYLLGSDFVSNDMVDQFIKFEKADLAAGSDPFEARRGRWVLIYGILQTLATVSVDTPHLHYTDASYHLSANLRGTPPWRGTPDHVESAEHLSSYCWTIPHTWTDPRQTSSRALLDDDASSRARTSQRGHWSPSRFSGSNPSESGSVRAARGPARHRWWKDRDDHEPGSAMGYARGAEEAEWSGNQESLLSNNDVEYMARDFDDHAM
jgi:hypothetical protein